MARKTHQDKKYLQLRGRVYWLYYRIPKKLALLPQFENLTYYTQSLQTDSLVMARRARDTIIARFNTNVGDEYAAWQDAVLARSEQFIQHNPDGHPETTYASIESEAILDAARQRYGTDPSTGEPLQLSASQQIQLQVLSGRPNARHSSILGLLDTVVSEKIKSGHSLSTINKLKNSVSWFLQRMSATNMQIADITYGSVHNLVMTEPCSSSTMRGYLNSMNLLYSAAYRFRYVTEKTSPFVGFTLDDDRQSYDSYTKQEIYDLYNASTGPLRLFIHAAATTGCRISEILAADIRTPAGFSMPCWMIQFRTKGKNAGATRIVPVHPSIDISLYEHGYGKSSRWISDHLSRLVDAVIVDKINPDTGKPRKLSAHSFRSSLITELVINKHVSESLVGAISGHVAGRSIGAMRTYVHTNNLEDKRAAVNMVEWNPI